LDPKRLNIVAQFFVNAAGLVDFERFLSYLDSTMAMSTTLAYIFGEISSLGQPTPRASEVLLNALKLSSNTKTLTHEQLAEALKRT
jgi:hypothetical protein